MPDTRLADISEFQPAFDAGQYLAGGYRAIIIRAHNGSRPDRMWPARRDYVRRYPFAAIGYYQYLQRGRDAAQQARDFVQAVGPLRGNEFAVLDHEEGAGSQIARAQAWFAVVDQAYGVPAVLYAGESFCNTNLGGWGRWAGRGRWVAAYRSTEPTVPHDLWQHTDSARFPGLTGGVDGSIYHGTPEQLLSAMRRGAISPPEGITPMAIAAVVASNGNLHVFVERGDGTGAWGKGSVWYTWQAKDKTAWSSGEAGKRIAGLSPFAPAPS